MDDELFNGEPRFEDDLAPSPPIKPPDPALPPPLPPPPELEPIDLTIPQFEDDPAWTPSAPVRRRRVPFSTTPVEKSAPSPFVEEENPPESSRRVPIGTGEYSKAPSPEVQSGFVNPALARIAAARPRQPAREASEWWLGFRTIVIVIFAALVSSFIYNYWTPDSFLSDEFVENLQSVSSTQGPPTLIPSPIPTFANVKKVGVIIGHSGPSIDPNFQIDPGAVCDDNNDGTPEVTELAINTAVGQRVVSLLVEEGYAVEVLNEWDARLQSYRADVLVSIHSNTCFDFQAPGATGYNVEGNDTNPLIADRDAKLAECVATTYAAATGLPRHHGRPPDLIDYHAFHEVSIDTAMVIVELGFLRENRQTLVERPDDMARGIVEGIKCFLEPDSFVVPTTPS